MRGEGPLLWENMSRVPRDVLAATLTLIEETSFWGVMSAKTRALWKRGGDEFAKRLEARTSELLNLECSELLVLILGELGGTIELADSSESGAAFEIRLPADAAPEGSG